MLKPIFMVFSIAQHLKQITFKTLTEFAKRPGNLLKKVLIPLKSLDSVLENDRYIFQVYRCIFF